MAIKYILLSFLIFFSVQDFAHAGAWEKLAIPGAVCGNGEPYSVFYKKSNSERIVVEFMGGGACWSEESCNDNSLANLSPMKGLPKPSIFTEQKEQNPWKGDNVLYLPYCTGDVFAGQHVAQYKKGTIVEHKGFENTQRTFEYLNQQGIFKFSQFTEVAVVGSSAGGIAALLHAENLNYYLNSFAKKYIISDSPGLHFGDTFWKKFSSSMKKDFEDAFLRVGMQVDFSSGLLAPKMGSVFVHYSEWRVGILQSTRDFVMSFVFGEVLPGEHRKTVLGVDGIINAAKDHKNASIWISNALTHTFLSKPASSSEKSMSNETAREFAYGFQEK